MRNLQLFEAKDKTPEDVVLPQPTTLVRLEEPCAKS
jgi:hypothetical protein